jgi:hypothetical protein
MVIVGFSLLFASLICLGSWPAILRLASTEDPRSIMRKGVRQIATTTRHRRLRDDDGMIMLFAPSSVRHRRRRIPRDARLAFLDYAFAYVVMSLIPLLSMMLVSNRRNRGSVDDSASPISSSPLFLFLPLSAMVGGILLSFGNMSLQWATSVYGAPLTTVVAIQASLTVTLGTTINYLLQPHLTHRPHLLLMGVLLFVSAISAATKAHMLYAKQQHQIYSSNQRNPGRLLSQSLSPSSSPHIELMSTAGPRILKTKSSQLSEHKIPDIYSSLEVVDVATKKESQSQLLRIEPSMLDKEDTTAPTANRSDLSNDLVELHEYDEHININSSGHDRTLLQQQHTSLWVAIAGGCCFGFFSPAFNIAVNDPFGLLADSATFGSSGGGLSVPVANLWFSLAFTVSSVIGTIRLMVAPPPSSGLKPILNFYDEYCTLNLNSDNDDDNEKGIESRDDNEDDDPVVSMRDSCFCCYHGESSRALGILAGFVCGVANLLQFQGGRIVGFATADIVQAYPIISTIWDVLLFGEYRFDRRCNEINDSSLTTNNRNNDNINSIVIVYLVLMYLLYFGGIISIVMSFAT